MSKVFVSVNKFGINEQLFYFFLFIMFSVPIGAIWVNPSFFQEVVLTKDINPIPDGIFFVRSTDKGGGPGGPPPPKMLNNAKYRRCSP